MSTSEVRSNLIKFQVPVALSGQAQRGGANNSDRNHTSVMLLLRLHSLWASSGTRDFNVKLLNPQNLSGR